MELGRSAGYHAAGANPVTSRQALRVYWLLLTVAIFCLPVLAQQKDQSFVLKRFEVVRLNPSDFSRVPPSMRPILNNVIPDGEVVQSLDAATKRAGFTPRMLKSPAVSQFVLITPTKFDVSIHVDELTAALQNAKVTGVVVPKAWDGVVIKVRQDGGILTDYGAFFIAQSPAMAMLAPPSFPLDQFLEVLFRIAGIDAATARTFRENFAKTPAAFVSIPARYEMDNRQVQLASGSGLLLQNAEKGGELVLMWSSGDRSFYMSGLMSEAQAIATANSLQ